MAWLLSHARWHLTRSVRDCLAGTRLESHLGDFGITQTTALTLLADGRWLGCQHKLGLPPKASSSHAAGRTICVSGVAAPLGDAYSSRPPQLKLRKRATCAGSRGRLCAHQ